MHGLINKESNSRYLVQDAITVPFNGLVSWVLVNFWMVLSWALCSLFVSVTHWPFLFFAVIVKALMREKFEI